MGRFIERLMQTALFNAESVKKFAPKTETLSMLQVTTQCNLGFMGFS